MEDIQDMFTSAFNVNAVKNDSLYAPLSQEGNVCGIGANLALVHDPPLHVASDFYTYVTVVDSVEPHSPASKAGLQSGDIIVKVDSAKMEYGRQVYLPDDVADMIHGPHGSTVVVEVERENGRRFKYSLTREIIDGYTKSSPVKQMVRPITPLFV